MASPTPKSSQRNSKTARQQPVASTNPPEVVDPIWLVKAIGFTLLAALLCGYAALCLLFYQGQWQLVLHPSRSTPAPTSVAGAAFQTVHFGIDESGLPQLTGWYIPSEPLGHYAADTLLYLPSGDGSLAQSVDELAALHALGINIFAFDYRGYGASAATHPNQRRMTEDASFAWQYLTVSRAVPTTKLVLFGSGVGCALAAGLAAEYQEMPAVILRSPVADVSAIVRADPRTRSLPVNLLLHDRFDLAPITKNLKTPKLFLIPAASGSAQTLAASAASPKVVATLTPENFTGAVYREQLTRFLDQSLR